MAEKSDIAWTDATFNPWWGCTKVSPACDNCYAERDAKRYVPDMNLWAGERRTFGEKHWNEPRRWNRRALKEGRRLRVFCASMADVFDKDGPPAERAKLWDLIRETPMLDWLILTKRIGNARAMGPAGGYPPNVWLGISVVNQAEADRDIPKLLAVQAAVHFLSCEPLLGLIDLHGAALDWVIVGGESGHKARPMEWEWARSLRLQCATARIAFFMKQLSQAGRSWFRDFEAFPLDLQVREWPRPGESCA